MPVRACNLCGKTYPLTPEFWHKHDQGFQTRCKPCACAVAREWHKSNPDRVAINHANSTAKRSAKWAEKRRLKEAAFVAPTHRVCNVCSQEFPRTKDFWPRQPRRTDGLDETCKACTKKRAREWYAANPKRASLARKEYREKNPAMVIARRIQYRDANLEKIRAANRTRKAANPERVKADTARYKARKRAAPGKITDADIRAQYSIQNGTCFYCPQSLAHFNFHVDHFTPLSKGGTNDPSNMVLACPACNTTKSAKLPSEFKPR